VPADAKPATVESVKFGRLLPRRARWGLLILAGALGILLSPHVGLSGGMGTRSFERKEVTEHAWGSAVTLTQFDLPMVDNGRGLAWMSVFMAGSLGAFYAGIFGVMAEGRRGRG